MQYQWLKSGTKASQVILIFGGWAIGPEAFAHLSTSADILYISDYRDLEADLPELHHYEKCVLVAWSFGVASYCHWHQGRADIF